jgi:tungstate transport system substrate-binding protein
LQRPWPSPPFLLPPARLAQDKSIIVQSTTSTQNSGLFDHILPMFESKTGIKVNVVAVGTGQAIKNAQNCDGDVLFVHARAAEEKFVEEGFGVKRHDVMYNDFVIVGPPAGKAGLRAAPTRPAQEDR